MLRSLHGIVEFTHLVMCNSASYHDCYHTFIDRTYHDKLVTAYCAGLVLSCLGICAFAKCSAI